MSRTLELTSTTDDTHHIEIGFDAGVTGTFSIQMWVTRAGVRSIDCLCPTSLGFTSFMGGNIYIHNDENADRCTLFGEKQDMKVGFVVNEQPSLVKTLNSLGIKTDDDSWEVESVTIPADKNHPDGMYSVIPSTAFKKRNGSLYSEFLRNMKTSGSTISALEAITGEQLRGRAAYVVLKNTSKDKVELWEIEVDMNKSR